MNGVQFLHLDSASNFDNVSQVVSLSEPGKYLIYIEWIRPIYSGPAVRGEYQRHPCWNSDSDVSLSSNFSLPGEIIRQWSNSRRFDLEPAANRNTIELRNIHQQHQTSTPYSKRRCCPRGTDRYCIQQLYGCLQLPPWQSHLLLNYFGISIGFRPPAVLLFPQTKYELLLRKVALQCQQNGTSKGKPGPKSSWRLRQ